jgi:hypothetical protein
VIRSAMQSILLVVSESSIIIKYSMLRGKYMMLNRAALDLPHQRWPSILDLGI